MENFGDYLGESCQGDSHASDKVTLYCMEDRGRQYITIDKEVAHTFVEMSNAKDTVRRSPRMKEIAKEHSSYVPSDEDS